MMAIEPGSSPPEKAAYVTSSIPVQVGERLRYVTGRIILDADAYNRLENESDPHQLMFEGGSDVAALGRGDIAGLGALHDVPCG